MSYSSYVTPKLTSKLILFLFLAALAFCSGLQLAHAEEDVVQKNSEIKSAIAKLEHSAKRATAEGFSSDSAAFANGEPDEQVLGESTSRQEMLLLIAQLIQKVQELQKRLAEMKATSVSLESYTDREMGVEFNYQSPFEIEFEFNDDENFEGLIAAYSMKATDADKESDETVGIAAVGGDASDFLWSFMEVGLQSGMDQASDTFADEVGEDVEVTQDKTVVIYGGHVLTHRYSSILGKVVVGVISGKKMNEDGVFVGAAGIYTAFPKTIDGKKVSFKETEAKNLVVSILDNLEYDSDDLLDNFEQ